MSTGAKSKLSSFNNRTDTLSGPVALCMYVKIFTIPCAVINEDIAGKGELSKSGGSSLVLVVKTEQKYS